MENHKVRKVMGPHLFEAATGATACYWQVEIRASGTQEQASNTIMERNSIIMLAVSLTGSKNRKNGH